MTDFCPPPQTQAFRAAAESVAGAAGVSAYVLETSAPKGEQDHAHGGHGGGAARVPKPSRLAEQTCPRLPGSAWGCGKSLRGRRRC